MFLRVSWLAAWTYMCPILFLGVELAGRSIGLATTAIIFAAGCGLIVVLPGTRALHRSMTPARMTNVGIATLSVLLTLFFVDTAYAVYENWRRANAQEAISPTTRAEDPQIWHGELFPESFFPTDGTFKLYKPNVRLTGRPYGGLYMPKMLGSPTLADSVLERRALSYFIGPHGLRELESLRDSRVFALGDSFVFGYGTDEGLVWTDLLGEWLGEPVFNLGVSGSAPPAQLALLEYLLQAHADSISIETLLWMIYEGNDLQNGYAEQQPETGAPPRAVSTLLDGTIVQALASIPGSIRNQSVLRKLFDGRLRFSPPSARVGQDIDGVTIYGSRLFHSKRLGYKLFLLDELDEQTQGPEYVLEHPNRPRLEAAFRGMKALSERHGFRVITITAPSASRLHGSLFDGFPTLSEKPHLIDYVVELAGRSGFQVVNLLTGLERFADTELLHYRDETHWNERGNDRVAALIEAAIAGSREDHDADRR